jgi:type II secretory pathway component PulF
MTMIEVGEEIGALSSMLLRVAAIQDAEADVMRRRLLASIEPALIVGLASIVVVVLALFLPIVRMIQLLG